MKTATKVFNYSEVEKVPCATQGDLDNLPILKYVFIEKLKQICDENKTLDIVCHGRIANLERFRRPNMMKSSSMNTSLIV